MTNSLNGTLLLSKIISLRQQLCTVCLIKIALYPIFSRRDSEIQTVFSIKCIEFLMPEPQKPKLCFFSSPFLRGSAYYQGLLCHPYQHRTWYQIWHGNAERQQTTAKIVWVIFLSVRPKYTKAKRTIWRRDAQAHTLLISFPNFHIFSFSNRVEDLRTKSVCSKSPVKTN